MAQKKRMLSEMVHVSTRFQRSVNLEQDYSPNPETNGYVVTPTARKALRRILDGLEGEGPFRSLTLTGPYGVGKSAFALFLTRLLCADIETRDYYLGKIREQDPALAQGLTECAALENSKKGFLPILITARRVPAAHCVLQGIADAVRSTGSRKLKAVGTRLSEYLEDTGKEETNLDTRKIAEELRSVCETAKEVGYSGTVLIVDELGKLFEYAARDSKKGDVYILQEIAELASRSDDNPLMVIGLLHQGFDEYARHLDLVTRQEWTKIQGRFTDIAFQEPTEQVMRLIASAISVEEDEIPTALRKKLRKLAKTAVKSGVKPPVMADEEFENIACGCFPLHPATLVALPILFNRFAQNERSLFSYLNSLEHAGFQEFLQTHALNSEDTELVRLPHLFDYFTTNFGAGLYRQPHARRWLEASDALDRQENLKKLHRELVKTIGVLSVIGEFSHLRATESVLANCQNDGEQLDVALKSGLQDLREASLLVYREFNNTYRVWEGSDIDIEERIADGERKVSQTGLAAIVQRYLVNRPMVARRHSFETGALRYFDLAYVDKPSDIAFPKGNDQRSDGQIEVCLAESSADAQEFKKRALDAKNQETTVFALPQDIGELRAAATELAALRWVWDNTPELRDDRVARREIALRITEAEQLLHRTLNGLLDPRPQPIGSQCMWFFKGKQQELQNRAAVSHLLSTACDTLYKDTPRIRNELLVRRSLSSAAAAGRRKLIEAMLTSGSKPILGIEGFPPERSMYESVLLATGVHREAKNGAWEFATPTSRQQHNLKPSWEFVKKTVFEAETEPVSVDKLFSLIASPPFGVVEGLQPVLLCAFVLVHPDETTLYREGTFLPEPGIADYEVMLRRPELFAISGSRATAGKRALLERMAKSLGVSATTVSVVRALFKRVNGLPGFAWRTRIMDEDALRIRAAFENASSPEQFLYKALPEALGLKTFAGRELDKEEVETFFGSLNGALQTWAAAAGEAQNSAIECLLRYCGIEPDAAGWQHLREMSLRIEPSVTDTNLLAFVRRVVQSGTENNGILGVLALVANRPPDSWSDADVERFPGAAMAIGKAFQAAVETVGLGNNHSKCINDLSEKDRRAAEKLLQSLRERVRQDSNASSVEITRAVLNELEAEIEEIISGKGAP